MEDPFRYCVFCKADCYADEPEHADDCPSSTGVFPVTERELGPRCKHCGELDSDVMLCMECGAEIGLGDHYTHRELRALNPDLSPFEGAGVYELVCLGCAAREELAV